MTKLNCLCGFHDPETGRVKDDAAFHMLDVSKCKEIAFKKELIKAMNDKNSVFFNRNKNGSNNL